MYMHRNPAHVIACAHRHHDQIDLILLAYKRSVNTDTVRELIITWQGWLTYCFCWSAEAKVNGEARPVILRRAQASDFMDMINLVSEVLYLLYP